MPLQSRLDAGHGACMRARQLLNALAIVELRQQPPIFLVIPRLAGIGGQFPFGAWPRVCLSLECLRCDIQSPHDIGCLIGTVGRKGSAADGIDPVGQRRNDSVCPALIHEIASCVCRNSGIEVPQLVARLCAARTVAMLPARVRYHCSTAANIDSRE
jgi:hypothetical protein